MRGNARDFEDVYREFVVDPATGPIKFLDLPMSMSKRALLYGQPAPELHITRGLGIDTKVRLSDYRGKWVVLEFWGVWCGPCIFHMGQVFRFSKQHANDRERFEIITVHHDIPEQKLGLDAALPQLVERWQSTKDLDQGEFPFPIVIDKTGRTVEAYGISGFPTSVFIDPEGRIANVPGVWELSDILKGRAEKSPDIFQAAGPDAAEHPPAIKPGDDSEGVVGQRCVAFNGHKDMVAAVGFLPDGKHFVTSASDNTLRFWNVQTRDQTRLIRCTPQGNSISSYGGIQLYIAQQGNLVGGNVYEAKDQRIIHFPRLWKADSDYQESFSLSDPGLEFGRADISADGERFASYTYAPDAKAEFVRIYDLPEGTLSHEIDVHGDRRQDASSGSALKFSPDGRHLAVAGAKGHSIQVWNVDEGRKLWEAYPSEVYGINSISFAPDGGSFAYAGWFEPLEFRTTTTGELLRTLQSPSHRAVVVSISPSGHYVATAGNGPLPRIKIWDINTGGVIGTLTGHATGARPDGMAWSPDDRYLVTVAGRGTHQPGEVLLWDLVENGIVQSP
ncbi:MAG TPA: redoxin domain-containing protein [Pirellulales bacterium]|nr:redoxin domain-containing protein [Pirellulales bacterium]